MLADFFAKRKRKVKWAPAHLRRTEAVPEAGCGVVSELGSMDTREEHGGRYDVGRSNEGPTMVGMAMNGPPAGQREYHQEQMRGAMAMKKTRPGAGQAAVAHNSAPGKGPKQIKFEVVYCSGEHPEFPASELNVHSPQTKGWQSPAFCPYPQEIGLGFLIGEVELAQLQILSHQSNIATKIDVYVGRGASYETCTFKRLGHLSLDKNERSGYAARELKSVYIGKQGSFLKLLIHKCHLSRPNIYNQTGIMAINVLGHPIGHMPPNKIGIANHHDPRSERPSYPSAAARQVPPLQDLAVDMNFDPVTAKLLREVHEAKERAVEEEEYELAKQLKEAESRLKHIGVKIAKLEEAKRDAVACEDYDQAAILKRDIQAVRGNLEAEIHPLLYRRPSARQPSNASMPQQNQLSQSQLQPQQFSNGGLHGHPYPNGNSVSSMNSIHNSGSNNNNHNSNSNLSNHGMYGYQGGDHQAMNSMYNDRPEESPHYGAVGTGLDDSREIAPMHSQQHTIAPHEDERPLPVLQHQSPHGNSQNPLGMPSPNGIHSARSTGRLPGGDDGAYNEVEPVGPATDPAIIQEALSGVAGAEDLPEAEPLPTGLGNEVQPLVDAFGEYLVRCLYSRQVRLRSAAMSKLEIDMDQKFDFSDGRIFGAICTVCRLSISDKIANIYMQGVKLLEMASTKANDAMRRQDIHPLVEPLMTPIVEKLGNNAARIRDATSQLLQHLARLKAFGVHLVTAAVLKLLRPGKSMLWRQLLGRLKLLSEMIPEFGMKENNGLLLEPVMTLITAYNGHIHPNAEVRECAKEVVFQAYAQVGEAVLPYLTDLRPKQMEEYEAGFDQIDQSQGRSPTKRANMRHEGDAKPTARSARSHGSPTGGKSKKSARKSNGGGGGGGSLAGSPNPRFRNSKVSSSQDFDDPSASSPKSQDVNININVTHHQGNRRGNDEDLLDSQNEHGQDGDESFEEEPFTCQFCGRHDPEFTDDALDIHYWKECPMLTSCLQCEQVIEVAMLNEHLLNECEMKHNHKKCPRCGEAIAAQYFNQHVKRASCRPAKPASKANRCPLCHDDVKPGEDGWREHILTQPGCTKNPRTEHLRGDEDYE